MSSNSMDKVSAWTSIFVRAVFKNGLPKMSGAEPREIPLPYQECKNQQEKLVHQPEPRHLQ